MIPKIAIYLAAYNGTKYLSEQVDSVLEQVAVDVTIFVGIDISSDGTEAFIQALAHNHERINLLPCGQKFGSAGKNFYRLILDSDITGYDYIAFADQDDIWKSDKLIRHINLLKKHGVEAVSSNVMAFWADGKKRLIKKSQQQRQLDYLFESAGPGCTFLMTPWLINKLKQVLSNPNSSIAANNVALHDWLAYAVCRASGRHWYIDDIPSVEYRQHSNNVVGANSGFKAKLSRLKKMSDGWYKAEVFKILQVCMTLSDDPDFKKIAKYLDMNSLAGKLGLLSYICKARRSFYDRVFLTLSIILGVF